MKKLIAIIVCTVLLSLPVLAHSTWNWGLDRVDQTTGIDGAYHYSNDGSGVRIYVVDTGIRASHSEVVGRVEAGYQSNGSDCNYHGTAMASAAAGNESGAAKNAILVDVRALDCNGGGSFESLAAGIEWVRWHHANVQSPGVILIAASGGTDYAYTPNPVEPQLLAAINEGLTVVVSAGNQAEWTFWHSPARMDNLIVVGASTYGDGQWNSSNYGPQMDLFAPGEYMRVAYASDDSSFGYLSGTSPAAAMVAGMAARVLELQPWAPQDHVRNMLVDHAVLAMHDVGPGTTSLLLNVEWMN